MNADQLVAHRGWPRHYPENSLAGITAALEAGARWVEWDLQFTRDGQAVLLHDRLLERVSGVQGDILDLELEELRKIPVGESGRFGTRFADTCAPTLGEAAQVVAEAGAGAFVELKPDGLSRFPAKQMLDRVCEALEQHPGRWILISASTELLQEARERDHRIGWIIPTWNGASRLLANSLQPELMIVNRRKLRLGSRLWDGDWDWMLYTVNEAASARRLVDRGARWIETDDIGPMLEAARGA